MAAAWLQGNLKWREPDDKTFYLRSKILIFIVSLNVQLGIMDTMKYPDMKERFGIRKFPTLLRFSGESPQPEDMTGIIELKVRD